MSTTACWKKIWLTVAGRSQTVTNTDARDVLKLIEKQLCDGILYFKSYDRYAKDASTAVLNVKTKDKSGVLEQFIQKLSMFFNSHYNIAWKIFCNFLIFEYYGKVEDIQRITEYEIYNTNLYQQLWLFYTSERMYMLKTLKHVLQFGNKLSHKFQKLYTAFITNVGITSIRNSLFEQYSALSAEIRRDNENCCLDFKDWTVRNYQEQFEILHCIIFTTEYEPFSINEFMKIFEIFKRYNFAANPSSQRVLTEIDPTTLRRVRYLQLSALLTAVVPFWEDVDCWQDHADEIESTVISTMYQGELSIMLITWATLRLTAIEKTSVTREKFSALYLKYTRIALEHKVFTYFNELVQMFYPDDCDLGLIVKRAIFTFVEHVSTSFEDYGAMLDFEGVSDLVAELVKVPEYAIKLLHSDEIFNRFYWYMIEMFPYSFVSFSKVAYQLVQHKQIFKQVFGVMNNFLSYTEVYHEIVCEPEVVLRQDYRPKDSKTLVIPAGSRAKVRQVYNTIYVTFDCAYTYFTIVEDLSNFIFAKSDVEYQGTYNMLLAYKIMLRILENYYDSRLVMMRALNLLNTMLLKVSTRPFINIDLLAICLNLFQVLLFKEGEAILENLIINNFLPIATKDSTNSKNFLHDNFLNTSILFLAIRDEIADGRQNLLFSYLKLITDVVKEKQYIEKVQLPGLVFLFVHVFPAHQTWTYECASEKNRLTEELLGLLLNVLQCNYINKVNIHDRILYDFCYELVVNHPPTVDAINSIFRTSNTYLQAGMMKETNWHQSAGIIAIRCLKKILSILNILLTLHNSETRCLKGTHFLNIFLDSTIKPSSLKLLTGYMQHTFDSGIPKLACQVLKKLAVNSDVAMLSLLEMDKYQLQCTFLEKLRDPLEEEHMKVAILDLVTLCVEKQNGMIVAFFDITQFPGSNINIGDSVTAFMEEYLENIKKSADYLNSPIQAAVLDLFHALWMYKKNILVADLTESDNFWTTLTDPLFKELKLPNRTYSQIFNILTFELFRSKGGNERTNLIVNKLFSVSEPYVDKWCQHILMSLDENNLVTYSAHLLRSWKNLLIATCKNYPECFMVPNQRKLLTESCLNGLIQHFSYPDDIRILESWAETYLYLITKWPTGYNKDYAEVLAILTRIFKYLGEYYCQVNNSLKETMLSIAVKTVKNLQHCTTENFLLIEEYLHAIGRIFEKEYMQVIGMNNNNDQKAQLKSKKALVYSNWILLLTFGTCLLEMDTNALYADWFKLNQFLHKVLTSIGQFIENPVHFPIAKITIQCLITYAQSSLVNDFLYENLVAFFDVTRPPRRYVNTSDLCYKNAVPWNFEEWWLTYTGIIHLMTTLLKRIGRIRLDVFFSFASIHDDIIKNSLKLPKVTTEHSALQLVSACLNFCHTLLRWKQEWRLFYPHIFYSYMQSVNETINAVTSIFLRPAILKFFIIDKESKINFVEHIPTACLVEIMNGLMEILALCCLCLLKASPRMMSLLDPHKVAYNDDVNIEYQFHIPKIFDETSNQLKYGSLLCLLHFLCKTLSQIQMCKTSPSKVQNTSLNSSDTLPGTGYLAFVCPDYFGACSVIEKYNSLQTFAAAELSGLSTRWLVRLDFEKVNFALEALTTLIAAQTFLTVHVRGILPSLLQHIKRELCSELLYFQEFTRKRISDLYQYRTLENIVIRKVYEDDMPYHMKDGPNEVSTMFATKNYEPITLLNYMAGDSTADRECFEPIFYEANYFTSMTEIRDVLEEHFSSIGNMQASNREQKTRLWYIGNVHSADKIEKIPVEKVALLYPTDNAIAQGDYLLMLSHWFFHMCQLSN